MDPFALALHAAARLNRAAGLNGRPFPADIAMTPRVGDRWFSWVHYGVMAPGLPEPHRFFNVMSILGTPGAVCFDNDRAIRTSPRDTAYVVSTTAATSDEAFRVYSLSQDCEMREDGSLLRFGEGLRIEGVYPRYALRRTVGEIAIELELEVTDKVAYFVHLPKVYDHWSLLSRYRGTITGTGTSLPIEGLCTFEYARGAGPHSVVDRRIPPRLKFPVDYFTYQVLNIDDRSQVLLTEAGLRKALAIRGAYERGLDDHGSLHPDARMSVSDYRPEPATTPDGREMRLPARWSWEARDRRGSEIIGLDCTANDDWIYGLGAGYVGSFGYAGSYRERPVAGVGYVEYIDC
jgi:hypothetical protein